MAKREEDSREDLILNTAIDVKHSRSASPSAEDVAEGSDQLLSRKREREVSLEPATPRAAATASSPHAPESKESRMSPAKKGRVQLDTTVEEDDAQQRSRTPSHPHSPPLSVSPPHEVKVRQISQGVEDISWRQKLTGAAGAALSSQERDTDHDVDSGGDDGVARAASGEDDMVQGEGDDKDGEVGVGAGAVLGGAGEGEGSVDDDERAARRESGYSLASATGEAEDSVDSAPGALTTRRRSDSDNGECGGGLKRKLGDRGTSQGPLDSESVSAKPAAEPVKRPRDDVDKDDNPRVTKRPSPPPPEDESDKKRPLPPAGATPKLSGFMAYASTTSPFAAVKGQNVFYSAKKPSSSTSSFPSTPGLSPSPSPFPNNPLPSSPFTTFSKTADLLSSSSSAAYSSYTSPQTPFATATKRSGFEAFAGSASPFASVAARSKSPTLALGRSKSPTRRGEVGGGGGVGAFSSYATGGAHAFAAHVTKRARAESPGGGSSRSSLERQPTLNALSGETRSEGEDGGGGGGSGGEDASGEYRDREPEHEPDREATFGEKLRAERDGDEGREEEEDGKVMLTEQSVQTGEEEEETVHQNQWRERGTGTLKLNVRQSDGGGARLVMRKEAVYTVILNVTLFSGMKCFIAQDPRYLRFSVIEDGATTHYNLRVSNAKMAQELLEEINLNIPAA
ncbi:hypothetical protein SERLA73DRAFT_164348 [Serpula lacrymans var. lacrymans S7.3]|uniref:RanBD1 domain-containing protein n=1 Tax=Serpula lacrymans var. lacrymans (strain S7.3) TaxID=936435 RepID=F8QIP9_SERL3|nr:hypothetical protein SERLA73DRAFT_164348 [Serpula lacrymans var. lacrymans S7.3]